MDDIKNENINENSNKGEKPVNGDALEKGTYEVLRNRLSKHGDDLKQRLDKLNAERKKVFGSIETVITGSERVITDNNCIPRDIVSVGAYFIFGYNVYMGLKSSVSLSDVFSIYEHRDKTITKLDLSLIEDKQFITDFSDLYKYYKNTFFAKFTLDGPNLYMVFQTGKSPTDIKAFKWVVNGSKLCYVDSRSDHEVKLSCSSDIKWERTRREDHREGLHPHISIKDKVFVETLEGDLTIKVENNTNTGRGIYSEPVEDKDQTLDDAEVYYSVLGYIVLIKIKPYKEDDFRYFVFNEKLKKVARIDAIKDSLMLLPDDHGLIFPQGYYLKSGESKLFDVALDTCIFDKKMESTNGEDFQYIFYNTESGTYIIYTYNIIEQTIETPICCSGYSYFKDGELIVFKHNDSPCKNHMLQLWQTPFVGKNYVLESKNDSILYKLGNKEIVRGMADCRNVCNLIQKGNGYSEVYIDIVKESEHIMDSYFWMDKEEAFLIKTVLSEIKATASSTVAEFEKVLKIKANTKKQVDDASERTTSLLKDATFGHFNSIDEFVNILAKLRTLRGEIISLKDLKYADIPSIEAMEKDVIEKTEEFSKRCIEFLLKDEGLKPYINKVQELSEKISAISKSSDGKSLYEDMNKTALDLELLIDIVSNFKIEDPTKTTEIIERISGIYSTLNQWKSKTKARLDELSKGEGQAQFASQMKLLGQSVVNYIDLSDSVDKCEAYLNKLMVSIQDLEGMFSDYDEYIPELSKKREEIYNAFQVKKQSIIENKNKKLLALFSSSERILKGLEQRLTGFDTVNDINAYFASDIMIQKVRDIISELSKLGDSVKADELEARLKTVKEEAIRQLKDKKELFVGDKNVIRLGRHHFSVNTGTVDLALVPKDGAMYFHITGTDFWEKITDDKLDKYKHIWDQAIVSETNDIYRAEYLAYRIYEASKSGTAEDFDTLSGYSDEELSGFIRRFMEPRYNEGYTKGVHDVDCLKILRVLLDMQKEIDLLVFTPKARAIALLFWFGCNDEEYKKITQTRFQELSKILKYFNKKPSLDRFRDELSIKIKDTLGNYSFFDELYVKDASEYLCLELLKGDGFVKSYEASGMQKGFIESLKSKKALEVLNESLKAVAGDLEGAYCLVGQWYHAYLDEAQNKDGMEFIDELIVSFILQGQIQSREITKGTSTLIKGLSGTHPNIINGEYVLSYNSFISRLEHYCENTAKDFTALHELKNSLTRKIRAELRLDEYKPTVLSSFVRNKLIDNVYIPLIGDNLAKQIGAAGENKRTDLMGMLLLISPPGYGKTTLMEYIANRLGVIFVKINGPAIGNSVVSLDPGMAGSASARAELEKLNMAFKMGNNVMIYVDDIQHCNPEFLQKFIPLCDGQRKIEGVYKGTGQSFDLRGKKVIVVMAGNPYTESGDKFQIPDMLANRADVYNLGDMLRENEAAFKLSYIENSITSNPILGKLSGKGQKDIYTLMDIAENGMREGLEFEGSYTAEEINEYVEVIKKLDKVRDIVLKINMEYMHSASQSDEYRKEPPFKLQGSYRNMNRISERVIAVMNDEELNGIILGSYENDAQTLTTGAEANLLKWKELACGLSEKEELRWNEIKDIYNKNRIAKSANKIDQAVIKLGDFSQKLEMIRDVLERGLNKGNQS